MFPQLLLGNAFPWGDLLTQEIPYRVFAADCFRHGLFPQWNPYMFNGMPFFAALCTAALYPTNLLLTFLLGDGSSGYWWIDFFIIAHYWLAAFGMYFLCRNELKQSGGAALLAGITFGFSGFMVTHEMYQGMIFQFAFLPWVAFMMMRGARIRQTKWFVLGGHVTGCVAFCRSSSNNIIHVFCAGHTCRRDDDSRMEGNETRSTCRHHGVSCDAICFDCYRRKRDSIFPGPRICRTLHAVFAR